MFYLVFIAMVVNEQTGAVEANTDMIFPFETIVDCFTARESLGQTISGIPGYFKDGNQAVCIYVPPQGE